ncbi:hypothetical protein SEA_FIREMAN_85 [Microbacterium phage Fireman]|uniref:Uncharacterized protein n=2 Tax=Metamorphoovirus TaxID=2733195 RepID=A0A481VXJ8_9CAUD|nr:membrane protein [Microbacterium phage RobsFeet]YP_009820322.1 hypothetical protein HOV22_gp87 [Microbacterium phage Fireman]AWY06094.1 hypothetical protein SEA_ROBSFEET_88 [Microbacterium phage RobsFeet]QBI98167.1 hypothetical protein SEA_FIREMAN_85 [Microbacterium phage Fireman]
MRAPRTTRATSVRRLQMTLVVGLCIAAPVIAGSFLAWVVTLPNLG